MIVRILQSPHRPPAGQGIGRSTGNLDRRSTRGSMAAECASTSRCSSRRPGTTRSSWCLRRHRLSSRASLTGPARAGLRWVSGPSWSRWPGTHNNLSQFSYKCRTGWYHRRAGNCRKKEQWSVFCHHIFICEWSAAQSRLLSLCRIL